MKKSALEFKAELQLKALGVAFTPEFRFHSERKWRFDFALPDEKIAVELEGAVWVQGRHTQGSGFSKDCEKYNEAAILGWTVLRYTSSTVCLLSRDIRRIQEDRRREAAWKEAPENMNE